MKSSICLVLLFCLFSSPSFVAGTATDDLNALHTSVNDATSGDVTNREAAKAVAEGNIASQLVAIQTAESEVVTAREDYLVAEADYLSKLDIYDASVIARDDKQAEFDGLDATYQAALAQKDGSDETEDYVCTGTVTVAAEDYVDHPCWSQHLRDLRTAQYNTEIAHIDSVLAELDAGDPLEEYTEASQARNELLSLKAELNAKIAYLTLMGSIQTQYVADLQAPRDVAEGELTALTTDRDTKQGAMTAAKSVMDGKAATVDTKAAALKTALDTLTSLQQSYASAYATDTTELDSVRDAIQALLTDVGSSSVTAKSALHLQQGGYAEIPAVNLRKDFTMEVWINFDPTRNDQHNLPVISQAKTPFSDESKFVFQLKLNGGPAQSNGDTGYSYFYWSFVMGSPDSPGYAVKLTGNAMQVYGWTHVGISVKTESDGRIFGRMFVNGELQATNQLSGGRWSSRLPIVLGKLATDRNTFFSDCIFDEFRVLSEAVTDAGVIATHMRTALSPEATNVRINIRFDDDHDAPASLPTALSTRLMDSSLNRLDGKFFTPSGLENVAATFVPSVVYDAPETTARVSTYALQLDSKAASQNYLALPSMDLTGAFTLEMWLKHKDGSTSAYYPRVSQAVRDGASREHFVFTLEMEDGSAGGSCKYTYKMGNCASVGMLADGLCKNVVEIESDEFTCTGWHHVAVMVTDSDVAKIFVDGTCSDEGSEPLPTGTCVKRLDSDEAAQRLTSTQAIQVGRLIDDVQYQPSEMEVDDIRFWNRARTQKEVEENMSIILPISNWDQRGMSQADVDLVAYYTLDEYESASLLYDRIVRNVNEVMSGALSPRNGYMKGTRTRVSPAF